MCSTLQWRYGQYLWNRNQKNRENKLKLWKCIPIVSFNIFFIFTWTFCLKGIYSNVNEKATMKTSIMVRDLYTCQVNIINIVMLSSSEIDPWNKCLHRRIYLLILAIISEIRRQWINNNTSKSQRIQQFHW